MLRRVLPLVLAGVLLACGGSDDADSDAPAATEAATDDQGSSPSDDSSAPGTTERSEPATSADPAVAAPEILRVSAPLVGGGEIELDAYAGRPVLLWFWAPW